MGVTGLGDGPHVSKEDEAQPDLWTSLLPSFRTLVAAAILLPTSHHSLPTQKTTGPLTVLAKSAPVLEHPPDSDSVLFGSRQAFRSRIETDLSELRGSHALATHLALEPILRDVFSQDEMDRDILDELYDFFDKNEDGAIENSELQDGLKRLLAWEDRLQRGVQDPKLDQEDNIHPRFIKLYTDHKLRLEGVAAAVRVLRNSK